MNKFYDVIIIGGGTAGCATAYIAGKLGLKVLLIEKGIHLGGTMTSGLVVPVMKSGNHQINTDFYNILVEEMHKVGGQVTYQDNSGWFNPELMKIVLDKMMKDVSVDVRYNAEVKEIPEINSNDKDCQIYFTKVEGDIEHNNFISSLKRIK